MRALATLLPLAVLAACGDDLYDGTATRGLVLVSGVSPFAAGCSGAAQRGTLFAGSVVEPFLARDPRDPARLLGVWQQDRWSNGGANGVLAAASIDGGRTWTQSAPHFSRCAGGTAQNGGDYQRASDPWVSIAPDGTAHAVALAFDGTSFRKAVLASRSTDLGRSWSEPIALATDSTEAFALDKESITADPRSAALVYAVWDRLTGQTDPNSPLDTGPTWFSRTTNGGATWEPARAIFDPGADAQTLGNQIAVLSDGSLVNLFSLFTNSSAKNPVVRAAVLRSTDQGATWSSPIVISDLNLINSVDPKNGHAIRSGDSLPALAVDPGSAALYVAWADGRFSQGARYGIALSRSGDGGLTWSTPTQVNGAPRAFAFTPALAVSRSGALALTYYDLRNDDPADSSRLLANAWLAVSSDGGATWLESAVGGPFDLRRAPDAFGYFAGDYQGLVAAGDAFVPFFVMTSGSTTSLYARPAAQAGVSFAQPAGGAQWAGGLAQTATQPRSAEIEVEPSVLAQQARESRRRTRRLPRSAF